MVGALAFCTTPYFSYTLPLDSYVWDSQKTQETKGHLLQNHEKLYKYSYSQTKLPENQIWSFRDKVQGCAFSKSSQGIPMCIQASEPPNLAAERTLVPATRKKRGNCI